MTPPRGALPRFEGRARLGFVLSVIGAFWTVVGVCIVLFPSATARADAGVFNALIAIVALLAPGLYLWTSAKARAARNERIERLAALAGIESQMPLANAASTLGIPTSEVRTLLLDAVSAGLLRGRIDGPRDVFLSDSAEHPLGEREVVCTSCGARAIVVARVNEAFTCPYCGAAANPIARG